MMTRPCLLKMKLSSLILLMRKMPEHAIRKCTKRKLDTQGSATDVRKETNMSTMGTSWLTLTSQKK